MIKKFKTDRLILRQLDVPDIDELLYFFERNRKFFEPWSPKHEEEFYTSEYQLQRISHICELHEKDIEYRFHIFRKEAPERVSGYITISNIVRGIFQSGYLGYAIDEKENGMGFATEAIMGMISFAFKELKLHRLEANVIPSNSASIRTLEKNGFVKEGYSKNYLKINDMWQDHFRFALLNNEYE